MTTLSTPIKDAQFMEWITTRGGNAVKLDYSSESAFHGHCASVVVRDFLDNVMNYVEGTDYIMCDESLNHTMVKILTWTKKGWYDVDVRPNDCIVLLEDRH